MTKSELAKAIIFKRNVTSTGEKRLIEATVDDVFDILLRKIVTDGEVKLARFGTFSVFSFKDKPRVAFYQSTRLGELLRRASESTRNGRQDAASAEDVTTKRRRLKHVY